MPSNTLEVALDRLDELKQRFPVKDRLRVERTLNQLARRRFTDARTLIRFHEILLFLRAYPHSETILHKTEALLDSFHLRVRQLVESGAADVTDFTAIEVSGIAGTTLTINWGYDIVRHLAAHHAIDVDIDWQSFENDALLVAVLKNFLPLFEDGAYVEYPIPFLKYLFAAKAQKESDLAWLLRQFESLSLTDRNRAALYDGIKLYVAWKLGNSKATRTNMRQTVKWIFYHDEPLITRREVSLAQELEDKTPLPVQRLSSAAGERFLVLARDAMTIRSRELHGFTYGDSQQVNRVAAGRGVEFYVWGVPPRRRLPLLGYHSALIFKNGVPIGYAESLSLFERTEFGLNLFYTFRDGESAWIYARLLRFFRQFSGVTVISVDPYQIGFHNEEAIDAGAFWFYRKLGFRPVRAELAKLVEREEKKIATRQGYRTPKSTLRKLATGHLLYEAPTTLQKAQKGEWDNFHLRHIGLTVQQRLAEEFGGSDEKLCQDSLAFVSEALEIKTTRWSAAEQSAFAKLALALALIPDLTNWPKPEKQAVTRIVRAKADADELAYLSLLQQHSRLREAMIKLGSVADAD